MIGMNIGIIVFALVCVFHIIVLLLDKENLRRISKCLIIPSLLAVYITGDRNKTLFVVIALVFGWLGDVLLIKIEKKVFFILGLGSFLLGHICYGIVFIQILGSPNAVNLPAALIFSVPSIVCAVMVFRLIKPDREMFAPVVLYMIILVSMNLLGLQVFLSNPCTAGLLVLSGCFCFMVSDTILAYYTFRKLKLFGSVLIMFTYILAQAEIVFGLMSL